MAKQQSQKESAADTRKLAPTEINGKWGFLDAATDEEVVPYIYMTTPILFP